ncbi:MAG: desulfoferrodoxin family protein [Patescibacteria group bacterium]|nr:desulfoferrodoxin family protein [Patescibacteria group bacterium]
MQQGSITNILYPLDSWKTKADTKSRFNRPHITNNLFPIFSIPMTITKEEKHTPVINIVNDTTVEVTVPHHPMDEDHWIDNITLIQNGELVGSKTLYPGEGASAIFEVTSTENLTATEHCNLHGTWNEKSEFVGM